MIIGMQQLFTYCFPAVLLSASLLVVSHLLFRHSIHQRANRLKLKGVNKQ